MTDNNEVDKEQVHVKFADPVESVIPINNDQSLNFVKGLCGIILWFIFGIKLILIGSVGYSAYTLNYKILWIKFIILVSSLFFGWSTTIFSLLMVGIYEFILRRETLLPMLKMCYGFCYAQISEQIKRLDIETSKESPENINKYKLYLVKYINLLRSYYSLITEKINAYLAVIKDYTDKAYKLAEQYDVKHYLEIANGAIRKFLNLLYLVLKKLPYVGPYIETFYTKLNDIYDKQAKIFKTTIRENNNDDLDNYLLSLDTLNSLNTVGEQKSGINAFPSAQGLQNMEKIFNMLPQLAQLDKIASDMALQVNGMKMNDNMAKLNKRRINKRPSKNELLALKKQAEEFEEKLKMLKNN